jgi:hypothetical protein
MGAFNADSAGTNSNARAIGEKIGFHYLQGIIMTTGKLLIISGIVLLVLGVIVNYAPWLINWFGKLPGDIRIEDEHKMVFIPITSMIVISIILTIVVNLFFRR